MSKAAELARLIGDGTFGTGGAEDKKIVFDGNAQDFHIGLDDSTDSLTIGLGSTLGTTSHMVIDENGQITKPLQAYFNAKRDSAVQLVPNTYQNITFATEFKDVGSNFNGTTFTAPVTGVYSFSIGVRLDNADTAASYYNFWLTTSNRSYHQLRDLQISADSIFVWSINYIVDMDANDTATFSINQQGGSAQTNVNNSTYFFGYLLG